MTRIEFRAAALALAGKLDAISADDILSWSNTDFRGMVMLEPGPIYAAPVAEWVEFLTSLGLGAQSEAYEAVAKRGWHNAHLIADASWEDTLHIAGTLARAQRSVGGDIFQVAHRLGMLSGVLRRLAQLSDTRTEF